MSNMSYCVFRNTLGDLQDAYEALSDHPDGLSPEERKARQKLIDLCLDIADEYGGGEDLA